VLDRFDVNSLTLTGKHFLPFVQIYVLVTVAGTILVPDGMGNTTSYSDYRSGSVAITSDSAGNVNATINPRIVIPPIPIDSGPLHGFLAGETLSFVASDSRNIWSNKLSLTIAS
jgi:hypothetical protein